MNNLAADLLSLLSVGIQPNTDSIRCALDRLQQAETLLKRLVGAVYNNAVCWRDVAMDAELYFVACQE